MLVIPNKHPIWRTAEPLHYIQWIPRDVRVPNSSVCFVLFYINIQEWHYSGVIMGAMASQITSLAIVYPTVYSSAHQRKYQSSALLAFARGVHRLQVNSPHKWTVTRKMFPFDDVNMFVWETNESQYLNQCWPRSQTRHLWPGQFHNFCKCFEAVV